MAAALCFFVFMFNIFVNSFEADYRIAQRDLASSQNTGSLMPLFHLAGELTGEVGVILRFAGACFLLAFAVVLVWKKIISWSFLRKAVLFEGIYYVFNIVFIVYLFVRGSSFVYYGAAVSYLLQILLVTPIFLTLYFKLKRDAGIQEVAKWGALAVVGFIFALWSKHFLLALYALPLDFSEPVFLVGFLNSVLTLLVAGVIMLAVFMPLIKKKSLSFNTKALGAALILAGMYVVIFLVIALFTPQYSNWVSLIDWWTFVFIILGAGCIAIKNDEDRF